MLSPTAWFALLLSAFIAQVLGTIAGFGSATVMTPIASLFLDIKYVIPLVAVYHLFANVARVMLFWRHIRWRVALIFGSVAVLCGMLGARLSAWFPSAWLQLLLGLFLVSLVLLQVFAAHRVRFKAQTKTLAFGGMFSGIISGLLGSGGAIRAACLLSFDLPKEVYLGTSAMIAFAVDLTRIPVYVANHMVPAQLLPLMVGLVVMALSASWLGERLVHKVSQRAFTYLVRVLLFLIGIKFLIDGWLW